MREKKPRLLDWRVRGDKDNRYLRSTTSSNTVELDDTQAMLLWHCNGTHCLRELAHIANVPYHQVREFIDDLSGKNVVVCDGGTQCHPFLRDAHHLKEIHFDVTGRCNLFGFCKHCFGKDMFLQSVAAGELTTQEMVGVYGQMEAMNVESAVMSGGEMFLRKDVPVLIAELRKRHLALATIFTNGTIPRDDIFEAIKTSGMSPNVLISMDGHTADTHDAMRGKGNFEKTLAFLRAVKERGMKPVVNTVVTRFNVHHLLAMKTFFLNEGIARWRCSIPREQGEALKNRATLLAPWNEVFVAYRELIADVLETWKPGDMAMQIGSVFRTEFIEYPVYYLFTENHATCEYKRNHLTMKPDGKVTPCTAFDNCVLGDIRTQTLEEIWEAQRTQAVKTLPVSATLCHGCKWAGLCGGGCRKTAYEAHGSMLARDTTVCPLYEFVGAVVVPMLEEHGITAAPMEDASKVPYDFQTLCVV